MEPVCFNISIFCLFKLKNVPTHTSEMVHQACSGYERSGSLLTYCNPSDVAVFYERKCVLSTTSQGHFLSIFFFCVEMLNN